MCSSLLVAFFEQSSSLSKTTSSQQVLLRGLEKYRVAIYTIGAKNANRSEIPTRNGDIVGPKLTLEEGAVFSAVASKTDLISA